MQNPDAAAPPLHTYTFGTSDGPGVLALHGVTGHGRRWRDLADNHLPEARWIAPDLRGHGRSTFAPPWNLDAHVDSVLATLDTYTSEPVVVVGHSFGAAIALHLAHRAPECVRALVLLDPAIGLDPGVLAQVADATISSPDYTDVAEARSEKVHGAWGEVPRPLLDEEIAEHLVELPNGRVNWRISVPALVSAWGELARPLVLPAAGTPTVLVQAMKVQPPYVTPQLRDGLAERLGADLHVVELDCDHMVPQARPADTAAAIRKVL
ncbi:alpha/beta fold hydrolase [Rhodococcus sp. HNM0569]|uniref:alpha/beta fold hydrolase n=1 Tax=Rhodococcus sp. HNM0569 TaxID=2716340 RepID=UPI003211DDF0